MKKFFYLLFFLVNSVSAHEIDMFLEQNFAKITSKPSYKKVDYLKISKKNDFRIKLIFRNTSEHSLKTIVIRYSIKLIVQKDSSNFETVSLISSNLRESEIKSMTNKVFYIYSINNLFREISRFKNAGYLPIALKVEVMKEPKKGEEILFKSVIFEIRES